MLTGTERARLLASVRASAHPSLPDHPVTVDPPGRGAGQARGVKVEHPTG